MFAMGSQKALLFFFFFAYLWLYWFCLSSLNKSFFIDTSSSWFLVLQTVLNLRLLLWRVVLRHSVSGCLGRIECTLFALLYPH